MDIQKQFQDFQGCRENQGIISQLDVARGEQIVFSCIVIKYNRFGMRQDRTLLLTNQNLYNIKKDSIQRKIGVDSVKALTKSTKDNSNEFVVHVNNEYDYRFDSEQRGEIFEAIKYVYWKNFQTNLPVYGVPERLKEHHTSKKDIQEGHEIRPGEQYRIKKEDIYPESKGQTQSTQPTDSNDFEINQANMDIQREHSNTLFMRKQNQKKVELQDFTIKSVIGKGSFGKVFLVQKKDSKKVYAMKSLRKDVILEYDQIQSTLLEKKILEKADHPFLVGMEYVIESQTKLFFVMKFVRGGELFMHLRQAKQFPEERAKIYSLTVALALGHLHSQKIIYRDLKPENILMQEDGYVCLTDFGLAKILEQNEQAYSFCGTPEYLAPEILQEVGHAFPVDWWALGILTYEMIVGFPPFYTGNSNNQKMYDLIKTKPVFFPDAKKHGIQMSENCKDFIKGCLMKDPKERLGSNGGLQEILSHPWFAGINIDDLLQKRLVPEFKPKLNSNIFDVSNFDKMFTSDEAMISVVPKDVQRKINMNQDKFSDFSQ